MKGAGTMFKRGLCLIAGLLIASCDFNVNAPEEIRTVHILCPASGDTIKIRTTGDGDYDLSGCAEWPDSVVIVTP